MPKEGRETGQRVKAWAASPQKDAGGEIRRGGCLSRREPRVFAFVLRRFAASAFFYDNAPGSPSAPRFPNSALLSSYGSWLQKVFGEAADPDFTQVHAEGCTLLLSFVLRGERSDLIFMLSAGHPYSLGWATFHCVSKLPITLGRVGYAPRCTPPRMKKAVPFLMEFWRKIWVGTLPFL